jgi:hypothetical protein
MGGIVSNCIVCRCHVCWVKNAHCGMACKQNCKWMHNGRASIMFCCTCQQKPVQSSAITIRQLNCRMHARCLHTVSMLGISSGPLQ